MREDYIFASHVPCAKLMLVVIFIVVHFNKTVVCLNVCDTRQTLNFNLKKGGFHRELDVSLEVSGDQASVCSDCQVVFEQTLPSGCYVNPDELADLRRMNEVMACPVGFINVETPEHESTPHTVHIYADLQLAGGAMMAAVKLPVHLRYHRATVGGSPATVVVEPPLVLLRSNSGVVCGQRREAPCGPCYQDNCEWFSVPYTTDTKSISVAVPVGNLNHASFVTVITLFITIACAVYVWKAVVDSHWVTSRKMKHVKIS